MNKTRCDWCGDDPLYMSYHDHEWGVPVFEDKLLFEFLIRERSPPLLLLDRIAFYTTTLFSANFLIFVSHSQD